MVSFGEGAGGTGVEKYNERELFDEKRPCFSCSFQGRPWIRDSSISIR
jgi:hypothetical protein